MQYQIPKPDVEAVVHCKPGAIEKVSSGSSCSLAVPALGPVLARVDLVNPDARVEQGHEGSVDARHRRFWPGTIAQQVGHCIREHVGRSRPDMTAVSSI